MGKTRNTGKLATQIQFDNSNNLVIGTSASSSFNTSGSVNAIGGITGSIFGIGDPTSFSSSISSNLVSIQSVTASNIARLSNLETKSSSVDISVSSINTFTSSNANTSLNSKTGSYATTGSNTFFGTQTYSGSVYIANDLIVQGSSSIQYISASSVSIGTNIVQLNTANPSVRFAGLTMIDSGSVGGSGSFLYDSLQDEFIFVHRGNGTNVTSSHFVLGPETYDSLGNETYLTCNRLTKGTGKEHLVDSCIFDNGTTTCIKNNLVGTGTISGTTIYGSTIVCSPVGKFTSCIDAGSGTFGSSVRSNSHFIVSDGSTANVVLQGYINNALRIAESGSASSGGSRGNLYVGALDVGGASVFSGDLCISTAGSTAVLFDGTNPTLTLRRNNNGNASAAINFKGSSAVKWQIGTNQATGLGFEINEGDATANKFYIAPGGSATFSNTETTLNFNPQTNLLASYYYLNFGGGSIMYRNATDMYIGSNSKYGSAGTTVANYTSIYGMGMITMDAGTLNYQANDTSVTAGTAYGMPIRFSIKGNGLVSINNVVASSSNYKFGVSGSAYVNGSNNKGVFITDNSTYASMVGLNSAIGAYNPLELRASGTDCQLYLTTSGNVSIATNLAVGRAEEAGVRLSVTSANTLTTNYNIISRDSAGQDLFVLRNDGLWYTGTRGSSPYNYGGGSSVLYVGSAGQLGVGSSTRESKTNIEYLDNVSWLLSLKPASFNKWERDDEGNFTDQYDPITNYGLIAEDVEEVKSDFVFYNKDNKLAGVHYDRLIAPMLKAIQEQQCTINLLKSCIGIV